MQAHCTYLEDVDLTRVFTEGTSIAHCPLSNCYFSALPFPLREALNKNIKVGLGSDIAGGYSLDMMVSMRTAVLVSRLRDNLATEQNSGSASNPLSITWKESLFLATAGGARALGRPDGWGTFAIGAPFDCQQSESERSTRA